MNIVTYKIVYTHDAQKDINDIWDGVWEASRDYDIADKYIDDLLDQIAEKKRAPKTGIPLYYFGLFTGIYSINFKAYKAFYRINGERIEVIRILLAKTDYLKTLYGDE